MLAIALPEFVPDLEGGLHVIEAIGEILRRDRPIMGVEFRFLGCGVEDFFARQIFQAGIDGAKQRAGKLRRCRESAR